MPENLIYDDLMICADDLQKDLTSNLRSEWNQKNYCTKCNDDALSQIKKAVMFFLHSHLLCNCYKTEQLKCEGIYWLHLWSFQKPKNTQRIVHHNKSSWEEMMLKGTKYREREKKNTVKSNKRNFNLKCWIHSDSA